MEPKDHTPIEGVLNRPGVTPPPPEMDWRCAIRDDGPASSAFDDFGGYYSVCRDGREIARFAPGPDWSEYAETLSLLEEWPDSLTYRWVDTSSPGAATSRVRDDAPSLDPEG